MAKKREYKVTKLQKNKVNQYTTTIPYWIVEKVLVAKKGDKLDWDFEAGKAIIKKREK